MELVKNRQIVDDAVVMVAADADINSLPAADMIVPLALWQAHRDDLNGNSRVIGVCLTGDDSLADIAGELDRFKIIALTFPVFRDGRGYSQAQQLRQRYGYTGEIRAVGKVLRDQLAYMERVGFNSFVIDASQKTSDALAAFGEINVRYQASSDEPQPLYRRA